MVEEGALNWEGLVLLDLEEAMKLDARGMARRFHDFQSGMRWQVLEAKEELDSYRVRTSAAVDTADVPWLGVLPTRGCRRGRSHRRELDLYPFLH